MHFPPLQKDNNANIEFDLLDRRRSKDSLNTKHLRASYSNIELQNHHAKNMKADQASTSMSRSFFKMFEQHKSELKNRFDTMSVQNLKQTDANNSPIAKQSTKQDFLTRLADQPTTSETTIALKSLQKPKPKVQPKKEPFSRLKDSYKRNQFVFVKFNKKGKKKTSTHKKTVSMPFSESEKQEKVQAILDAGFTHHPDISIPAHTNYNKLNSDLFEESEKVANYRITESSLQPNLASTCKDDIGFKTTLIDSNECKTVSTSYPTPVKNSFLLNSGTKGGPNHTSSPINMKSKIGNLQNVRYKSQPKAGKMGYIDKVKVQNEFKNTKFSPKIASKKPKELSARQKAMLFAKSIKKPTIMCKPGKRSKHKIMDAELNTVLDEGEAEEGSQLSERLIFRPKDMKLIEQTIKMLY